MSMLESYSTPPSANSTRIVSQHSGQIVETSLRVQQNSSHIATPADTSTAFIRNYLGKTTINSTAISTIKTMRSTSKSTHKTTFKSVSSTTAEKRKSVVTSTAATTTTSQESGSINISVISASASSDTNNEAFKSPKVTRKSVGSKKPIVVRKSITATKISSEAPKPVGNCKTVQGIEKVLRQIKMTKYMHSFKKVDFEKFKSLREIDLNAIGITRPSEIKIFKEAINKAKSEKY